MAQRPKPSRIAIYTGSGMAIGAALGLLFGLMLPDRFVVLPLVGVVFGAVVGTIWGL